MNKKYLSCMISAALMTFSGAAICQNANAATTTSSDYQAQLQQIKNDMALMQKNYQQQIDKISQQIKQSETTKAENKKSAMVAKTQSTTEASELDTLKHFAYGGYFRSGYGVNKNGNAMSPFQNPDSPTKYRLGNEPDTYGELILGYNSLEKPDSGKPNWQSRVRVSYAYTPTSSVQHQESTSNLWISEAYVSADNVLASDPGASFWGGQRFYRLDQSQINDFYFLDMSGVGAGVQNLSLGDEVKLDVAFIGGPDIPADYTAEYLGTDHGNLSKSNLDFQIHNIKMGNTHSRIWLNASYAAGGTADSYNSSTGTTASYETAAASGFGVGFFNYADNFFGGKNTFAIMYGHGSSANFKAGTDQLTLGYSTNNTPITINNYDLNKAYTFRTLDFFTIPLSKQWKLTTVGIYQHDRNGNITNGQGHTRDWFSFGVRPCYMFNDIYGLQFEAGADYVNTDQNLPEKRSGTLGKLTVMPFIQLGVNTQLRTYLTYATWSNDYKDMSVGGGAYDGDTNGWNAGVQLTTSW
ncbi:carbohydrate porin [Dongshaea marina]|uniref:carbohydrate porin n=1 Tax=Dongshaea marina TaxID=2047966 RepID=UPI000D3E4E7D|nr:carbohydrate porin [Dongshaea marina]